MTTDDHTTRTVYSTRSEAIGREIVEAIEAGGAASAAEYDITAIADAVLTDVDAHDAQGRQLLHASGYAARQDLTTDQFWEIVADNALPTYEVDLTSDDTYRLHGEEEDGDRDYTSLIVQIPDAEDTDIAVLDGDTVPTQIPVPVSEDWDPESIQQALANAGWTIVGQIPDAFTPALTVVRAQH